MKNKLETKDYIQGIAKMIYHPIQAYKLLKACFKLIEDKQFLKKLYGDQNGQRIWEEVSLKPAFGKNPDYRSIDDIFP